jgi:hypothetical protein
VRSGRLRAGQRCSRWLVSGTIWRRSRSASHLLSSNGSNSRRSSTGCLANKAVGLQTRCGNHHFALAAESIGRSGTVSRVSRNCLCSCASASWCQVLAISINRRRCSNLAHAAICRHSRACRRYSAALDIRKDSTPRYQLKTRDGSVVRPKKGEAASMGEPEGTSPECRITDRASPHPRSIEKICSPPCAIGARLCSSQRRDRECAR